MIKKINPGVLYSFYFFVSCAGPGKKEELNLSIAVKFKRCQIEEAPNRRGFGPW